MTTFVSCEGRDPRGETVLDRARMSSCQDMCSVFRLVVHEGTAILRGWRMSQIGMSSVPSPMSPGTCGDQPLCLLHLRKRRLLCLVWLGPLLMSIDKTGSGAPCAKVPIRLWSSLRNLGADGRLRFSALYWCQIRSCCREVESVALLPLRRKLQTTLSGTDATSPKSVRS